MKKVYVAGPMTGLPDLNFPAFHAAAANLRALGLTVVNPAEINSDPNTEWTACMRADIAELVTCDAIFLLPGWENSRGAKLEHHIADALGMAISYAHTGTNGSPDSQTGVSTFVRMKGVASTIPRPLVNEN